MTRRYQDIDGDLWTLPSTTEDGTPAATPTGPTIHQIAEKFGPLIELDEETT